MVNGEQEQPFMLDLENAPKFFRRLGYLAVGVALFEPSVAETAIGFGMVSVLIGVTLDVMTRAFGGLSDEDTQTTATD
jgi:hypothetical protein